MAANVNKASGIIRAAPYIANSNDASVGIEPAGTTTSGRKIAAMVKALATRTLIAVTSEASRIAFIFLLLSLRALVIYLHLLSSLVMFRAEPVGPPPPQKTIGQ